MKKVEKKKRKQAKPPVKKNPRRKYQAKNSISGKTNFTVESENLVHILDSFSDKDLEKWEDLSEKLQEYNFTLYYSLSYQRERLQKEIDAAVIQSAKSGFAFKDWQRLVRWKYSNNPLSVVGSLKSHEGGGRFNISHFVNPRRFPPFGALYVGSSRNVAIAEVYGLTSAVEGLNPQDFFLTQVSSVTYVALSGYLESYIDLRDANSIRAISRVLSKVVITPEVQRLGKKFGFKESKIITTPSLLIQSCLDPNWRRIPALTDIPANCQIFGEMIRNAGIEGIVFPSVRFPEGICVAVFPENFKHTASHIEVESDAPDSVMVRRIDKENCLEIH